MMMMKRTTIVTALLATAASVQAFAPLQSTSTSTSLNAIPPNQQGYYSNAADKLVGNFHEGLNQNTIPLKNKYFPKADTKLVGSFYKELNTQIELKNTPPAAALPKPEVEMTKQMAPPPPPAAVAVPPPAMAQQPAAPRQAA